MGLWDTIKGWFNIGGVKVKLRDIDPKVAKKGSEIKGRVDLVSKGDKHVLKMTHKFVLECTKGSGDDRETEETVLGKAVQEESFDIKTGETKTVDFLINYDIPDTLADKGGVLGAVGKLGAFASREKREYFVISECDVKGTAFDPSDRFKVSVVDE